MERHVLGTGEKCFDGLTFICFETVPFITIKVINYV